MTETVEQNTCSPRFTYEYIHQIPSLTNEFQEYLETECIEFEFYISPYVTSVPEDEIGSDNPIILENINKMKNNQQENPLTKDTFITIENQLKEKEEERKSISEKQEENHTLSLIEKKSKEIIKTSEERIIELEKENFELKKEIEELKKQIQDSTSFALPSSRSSPLLRQHLEEAIVKDAEYSGQEIQFSTMKLSALDPLI